MSGRSFGLKTGFHCRRPDSGELRQRSGDRLPRNWQKLALYIDASPHSPKDLDHDAVDAVGADETEGDVMRLAISP